MEIKAGHFIKRVSVLLLTKGMTDAKIKTEMIEEQIGSAIYRLKYLTRTDDIITPIEPRASAKICKYMP